ncbi:MAG: Galactokinase [Phycisphaerae bacterium]|nr:Galactokinase [Phycisphaerae bacterium]
MIDPQQAIDLFAEQFTGRPDLLVHSPGRVNLIGEHVDYSDGLVMPMAIDRGTTLAVRARDDGAVNLFARRFGAGDRFDLGGVDQPGRERWSNYVRGVAALLLGRGLSLRGADITIDGDLPVGGGLSSSASLEVGAALAFLEAAGATLPPLELARLCQQAEHEYAGVPCGLMDQYSIVFGTEGMAVLLDCRSATHELVPADHAAVGWLIIDSCAPRELASGEYAKRRSECDRALAILRKANRGLTSLRDATLDMIEASQRKLGDLLTRRARHVVTEIARVREGAEYLRMERYDLFGRVMYSSHLSLARDYEVSIDALDHIVAAGDDTLGVYGCRMTGGGFGGCCIALLAVEAAGFFAERVGASYHERFGRSLSASAARPSPGARVQRL